MIFCFNTDFMSEASETVLNLGRLTPPVMSELPLDIVKGFEGAEVAEEEEGGDDRSEGIGAEVEEDEEGATVFRAAVFVNAVGVVNGFEGSSMPPLPFPPI